jgi:hypothetical protein
MHVPEDDVTRDVGIVELHHIVLELRRLPVQVAPSSVLCVLANAIQMLTSALKLCAGRSVGADEIFQFFIFCLSMAKLPCLPALVSFVDTFIDDALRETKFDYYIEQLRSSLEFIDNRFMPVQPFVILPIQEPPPRLQSAMRLISSEPVSMKGFDVYAMPTWSPARFGLFPAMIRYTGTRNFAKCYKFEVFDTSQLDPGVKLDAIATLEGTFLQLTQERIEEYAMIQIDDGDFMSHIDDITAISAMMKMVGAGPVLNPSVGKLEKLFGHLSRIWRLQSHPRGIVAQIRTVIEDVQRALIAQRLLPPTSPIDGVLDVSTLEAIEKVWSDFGRKSAATPPFPCAPRVFKAITDGAKRRRLSNGSESDAK